MLSLSCCDSEGYELLSVATVWFLPWPFNIPQFFSAVVHGEDGREARYALSPQGQKTPRTTETEVQAVVKETSVGLLEPGFAFGGVPIVLVRLVPRGASWQRTGT